MKRLIKNGNVILDGTLTRREKEIEAFCKLGFIEEVMKKYKIEDLTELELALAFYHSWFIALEKYFRKEKKL